MSQVSTMPGRAWRRSGRPAHPWSCPLEVDRHGQGRDLPLADGVVGNALNELNLWVLSASPLRFLRIIS